MDPVVADLACVDNIGQLHDPVWFAETKRRGDAPVDHGDDKSAEPECERHDGHHGERDEDSEPW